MPGRHGRVRRNQMPTGVADLSRPSLSAPVRVDRLRELFRHERPGTVGIEEEVMVLDAATLDLSPSASDLVMQAGNDERFKTELPAAQLEIVLAPAASAEELVAQLRRARGAAAMLAARSGAVLAGAGVHPFASGAGQLNGGPRYTAIAEEFAGVARRQLVFGLHVHVALDGPDEALAVYNAIREHLPALAALGANAPYYEGQDTGLASVRPKLNELLPRQGIPPALASWDAVADMHAWGRATGAVPDAGQWWWEARLHPVHGTLEVRVCDTQATVADTAALTTTVRALAAMLAARHRAGDLPEPAPTWRIAENRWSACRHGVDGRWFDVRGGAVHATRDHLHRLLDELTPFMMSFGSEAELSTVRSLVDRPRAARFRALVAEHGPVAAMQCLADDFLG
jgi:carboxylate-amine ligase